MTTSGSTDYSRTAQQLIDSSARVLGVLAEGQTLPGETNNNFLEGLNVLIKNIMAPENLVFPGLKLFQRVQSTITMSSIADNKFIIKTSGGDVALAVPVDIIEATLKDSSSNETPLKRMTLAEYMAVPNKTSSGTPTRFYYERHASEGDVYFDCVPSVATWTMAFTALRMLEDVDTVATDEIDFPVEYYRVFKFLLAKEMWAEYPTSQARLEMINDRLNEALYMVNTFAPDSTPIYFQPDK